MSDTVHSEPIQVMLVDDHPLLREGLRAILGTESDLRLVAEACSGSEALSLLGGSLRPAVVLLDIRMPEMDGLTLLRELRARFPEIAVIILTMHESESYLNEALALGASGYVLKDQACELIPLAIRTVSHGGTVLPPGLLSRLMPGTSGPGPREPSAGECPLSPRELSIVSLIARGFSNRAIAEELHLAEATIKKYVQSLTGKLGAGDRGHAAVLAMRLGFID